MKEGSHTGTLYYGNAARAKPEPMVPEDVGLSMRRSKASRSRFDVDYQVSKWDSEEPQPSKGSQILEDYLLEDEEDKVSDEGRLSQWKSITDEPPRSSKKSTPPVKPPEPIAPAGWQPVTSVPPPGFPFGQPPPTLPVAPSYDATTFYPYDYQQTQQQQQPQYQGYNYYQGYQDFSGWGTNNEQPPPPGLMLPDMSQPPPMNLPISEPAPPPVSSPVPPPTLPVKKEKSSPSTRAAKKLTASSPQHERKSRESDRKSGGKKVHKGQEKELIRQREEYMHKSSVLTKELGLLQDQKELLLEEGASLNSYILKENNKLQEEIRNKLVAIQNVIEMLSELTGAAIVSKSEHRVEKEKRSESSSSKERVPVVEPEPKVKRSPSLVSSSSEEETSSEDRINYSFFDPEEHWCRVCDVFPATAKEYLNHLQSEGHKETIQTRKLIDLPWHNHSPEKERSHFRGAPTRRVPIKGLQFFIAPTAWYCKLCNTWIGDLHCASIHLKSQKHMDNYEAYVTKNADWEETWAAERHTAMSRCKEETHRMEELQRVRQLVDDEEISAPRLNTMRESLKITVANDEVIQEDLSRSIRVTMRNKPKPVKLPPMGPALPPTLAPTSYKKTSPVVPPVQSNGAAGQWVVKPSSTISDTEKQLLKNLKDKHKLKQDKEDFHKREERGRDRKKERRFRERSYERSRSRSRSRSNSRGRQDRSNSKGQGYGRDDSRERNSDRSYSRERRRRRQSSSPRRRSRSRSPKPKKVEAKQWVAPPSSPPPYMQRKNEDKEKWDKPKKKAAPNPVSSLPKSKLPFIGKMPTLKNRKKTSDDPESENQSEKYAAPERRTIDDMEIDSGASDAEESSTAIEVPEPIPVPAQEEEPVAIQAPAETTKTVGPGDIPLPQDFQDALSILFPEALPPEMKKVATPEKKPVCNISQEELMMLGIDPDDMVAQEFSG